MGRDLLYDGHGRQISDLRVSVTDRCNFRCQYCMPADGLPWLEREQILSFEEIERVVAVMAGMGVSDVRLTGGEPLVRRDFPRLVSMLSIEARTASSGGPNFRPPSRKSKDRASSTAPRASPRASPSSMIIW